MEETDRILTDILDALRNLPRPQVPRSVVEQSRSQSVEWTQTNPVGNVLVEICKSDLRRVTLLIQNATANPMFVQCVNQNVVGWFIDGHDNLELDVEHHKALVGQQWLAISAGVNTIATCVGVIDNLAG